MSAPQLGSAPPAELFFQTVNAYQRTAALRAAIELDVFSAIAEGNVTSDTIAGHVGASVKGIRVLCDYLTVAGFLEKANSAYALTADSAFFLDRRSPAYLGGTLSFLLSESLVRNFTDLATTVRRGGAVTGADMMTPDHPAWCEFARAMVPMMAMPAEHIAGLLGAEAGEPWKVLDIAAGHGLFGIAVAKRNPKATVVAVDWPHVLEVASEHAYDAGVADRYSTIAGDAFSVNFGDGYDVILLTNFLHHFSVSACEAVLRRVHSSLKPGGRVATLEFVPNKDRVSPPVPAMFSLMMLGNTEAGDAYTFAELSRMFAAAGFPRSELHPIPGSPQQVILSWK
jgi:SAM-dependent methyltransferase